MKCGKEWTKESTIRWGPDDFTSSLCDACFQDVIAPIIHKKQRKEGNFDCFGKADAYCDQPDCRYREWCLRWGKARSEPKAAAR
jgi:hypothetical protein